MQLICNQRTLEKYWPVTFLPTLYKIITSCIAQQKGCTKHALGFTDQLIIDSIICNKAHAKKRNLFMAYTIYKKTFDSVPHDWLFNILTISTIDPLTFLGYAVSNWRNRIHLDEASYNILADSMQERYIPEGTAEPVGVLLSNESSILTTMDFPLNITISMQ